MDTMKDIAADMKAISAMSRGSAPYDAQSAAAAAARVEGLKLPAKAFDKDVAEISCCPGLTGMARCTPWMDQRAAVFGGLVSRGERKTSRTS